MAAVTFKFRQDLFEQWWAKYEVELGIEAVIVKFKTAQSLLDIIIATGDVADALKKSGSFAQKFITDDNFRDEIASDIDSWLDFGGIVGATLIESLDKRLIKMLLDMAVQKVVPVE